ncbi:hypothetical protein PTKIN_Ptkin08bG0063500 [Pterospermum kingtungense]
MLARVGKSYLGRYYGTRRLLSMFLAWLHWKGEDDENEDDIKPKSCGILRIKLLRDKLLVPRKSAQFGAMVLAQICMVANSVQLKSFDLQRQAKITIVASLEIIPPRGMFNFFKLENDHLNKVGKFRAFKSVPLPFNYDEEEDKR